MQKFTITGYSNRRSDDCWFFAKLEKEEITKEDTAPIITRGLKDYSADFFLVTYTVNGVTREYRLDPTKDRKGYTRTERK